MKKSRVTFFLTLVLTIVVTSLYARGAKEEGIVLRMHRRPKGPS